MTQEQALALLKSGRNVFLTGSAGTGKTYVLNQYIDYLKERKMAVAVTASTGIAATHMNGMTIHAWAGIGIKDKLNSSQLKTLKSKKYLQKKLDKVKVLIIDEISMLHKNQFEAVDQVLKYFKLNQEAYGGIQVVLCGDFFQLPPVGNENSKEKFAFMSPIWIQLKLTICYLTEQYRQGKDQLTQILNEIRSGQLNKKSYMRLAESSKHVLPKNIEPTKLYTHNIDVDEINLTALKKLKGKSKSFVAETKGNEKLVEGLKKSVQANEFLELKIGAKVMFVKNINEKGVVNGSLGTIVDFDEGNIPLVKLLDDRIVSAEFEEWKIEDENGKSLANYSQIPLRLAWAITIHKSQGMTLDAAEVDLSKTFEKGQGYVALSRLRELKNLRLLGINEVAIKVDPLAFKADQRFQSLSKTEEESFNLAKLAMDALQFVRECDGLTDEKELKKQKNKLKNSKNSEKESTYDITYTYMKQSMSLEKIADERGMSVNTIAGHLIKIKKDHPEANLSLYKPKKSIVDKVEIAYKSLPKSNATSLKLIYESLNSKVSYMDIKLALAFII